LIKEVIATAALNGKHCGRPTSREKRARCGAPKLRGKERVQNPTLARHGSFTALAEQDGCLVHHALVSLVRTKGRKREKDRPLMGLRPVFFGPRTLVRTWGTRPGGKWVISWGRGLRSGKTSRKPHARVSWLVHLSHKDRRAAGAKALVICRFYGPTKVVP
jgi:hypothetical protein